MAHLIDKDAVLAEIVKQKQLIFPRNTGDMRVVDSPKPLEQGWLNALKWMEGIINPLEVKEVDLEKEIDTWYQNEASKEFENVFYSDIENCAKHFFELGLKAQKGE